MTSSGDEATGSESLAAAVVICAYSEDRWSDIHAAVDSALEQTVAAQDVVVVIDNNPQLLERARAEFEQATVVPNEAVKGLSGGRLTGSRHTSAEILIFLDDDAQADREFVQRHLAAYDDPKVLGVGGRIDPDWRSGEPDWFPREFLWVVGCTYKGMPDHATPIRNPIGANMSIRASVLEAAGGFAARFGRTQSANGRISGTAEETEFAIRAAQSSPGSHWLFEPHAIVRHAVTKERSTWRYFLDRCKLEGTAKALLSDVAGSDAALESERTYAAVTLPKGVVAGFVDCIRGDFSGPKRSGAILIGLGVTAIAYLRARLSFRAGGPEPSATIGDDRA